MHAEVSPGEFPKGMEDGPTKNSKQCCSCLAAAAVARCCVWRIFKSVNKPTSLWRRLHAAAGVLKVGRHATTGFRQMNAAALVDFPERLNRNARRHEAVRAQRQAAEEAECSFTPRTNRARNDALLKGQLSWAAPANDAPKPVTAQGVHTA